MRDEYIRALDDVRKLVADVARAYCNTRPFIDAEMTEAEMDRRKKTAKLFDRLHMRLYEDAAISAKIQTDGTGAADCETAEFGPEDGEEAEA